MAKVLVIGASGFLGSHVTRQLVEQGPDYIRCRVDAENLCIRYCSEKGLPGVACCVGNTYGPGECWPLKNPESMASAISSQSAG